jgi:cation diffusion facilitator CzcD-associated flavoprotein CzcO
MTSSNRALAHKGTRDVEAGAKAGVKNLFSLGGDAGRSWSNQVDAVVESVHIRQDGCDDISPTMPFPSSSVDIKEAANISRQVQRQNISSHRGSPKIALLKHYRYVK